MRKQIAVIYQSKAARTLVPALAGFCGYGGWAVFCNSSHGWEMALRAGVVQGSLSFVITLVFNGIMEFVYKRLKNKFWSILISSTGFIAVSYTVNTLAGTPEVLSTIAPGAVIGSLYVASYIKGLAVLAEKQAMTEPD